MANVDENELDYIFQKQQDALAGKGFTSSVADGGVPSYIRPPEGHEPFVEMGSVALGAVGVTAVVHQFTVPEGFDGVIEYMHHATEFGGFVNGSGDLVWQILADARPIRNFNNITSQFGAQTNPVRVSNIRVYSGQIVQNTVNHVANAALNGQITASFLGYFYPRIGG